MWTYSTNVMGPYGLWWYEKNNIPYEMIEVCNEWTKFETKTYKNYLTKYYGGRIDCRCTNTKDPDYDPYGQELGLPIMEGKYFALFSNWLENIKTESLVNFECLKEMCEKELKTELIIFEELT